MVLTSLIKIDSKSLHNILFPANRVIKTCEYSENFFVKILTEYNFKQVYVFGSISIVNDVAISEKSYLSSTIGLVKS